MCRLKGYLVTEVDSACAGARVYVCVGGGGGGGGTALHFRSVRKIAKSDC